MDMPKAVAKKIEDFFSNYQTRKYAKGQVLLLSGEDNRTVYHLLSGTVKQYEVTKHGDEIILNIFKPPAFFPMSLAINKTENLYIYEADSAITVQQAPADEAVLFVKNNPDVMFDLLSRLYRGMDGLLGRMTHLMASSAKDRLIYELVIESRRFGNKKSSRQVLNINEIDLAARAGLSRETVSREMQSLKQAGLVSVTDSRIVVNDLKTLEKQIGLS